MSEDRLEKKFVYNQGDESFQSFIINGMFKETFSPRVVNSIYFDTTVYHDVWDNINGFGNRKKIRIRWYNKINNSNVFIEEKKKLILSHKKQ
jgi:SPX domain protein involved in polyphosphate accumulation